MPTKKPARRPYQPIAADVSRAGRTACPAGTSARATSVTSLRQIARSPAARIPVAKETSPDVPEVRLYCAVRRLDELGTLPGASATDQRMPRQPLSRRVPRMFATNVDALVSRIAGRRWGSPPAGVRRVPRGLGRRQSGGLLRFERWGIMSLCGPRRFLIARLSRGSSLLAR
jgi:hypothetical protein